MTKERELLRRALKELEIHGEKTTWGLIEEILTYLATPSDDAKEPVSDYQCRRLLYGFMLDCNALGAEAAGIHLVKSMKTAIKAPKPAEPAARKPMTREEIIQGVTVDTSDDFHAGYWAGIRFAEKHHGIGGSDE